MSLESWVLVVAILTAIFSVGLSTFAVLRALIPPQTRAVLDLRTRVEDVEDDNDRLHGRLNERAARQNMEKARDVKVQTRQQQGDVVQQAAALLAQKQQQQPAPAQPTDPEAYRNALRRKHLNG